MENLCESIIANDISFDCDDLVVRGLESDGLIINRRDIDLAATVYDNDNKNIIKTLVLKTGKRAYEVVQNGATPFTGTQTTLTVGANVNSWQNIVQFVVLANSPTVSRDIIDGLANGQFVAILKNLSKGATGNAKYQIYGYAQGLRAQEITSEKWSEDTDGGWLVSLQEAAAKKSALFLFNTDEATTDAAYEALKTAAQ